MLGFRIILLCQFISIAVTQSFNTSVFGGELGSFGVLKSLRPNVLPSFDFSPSKFFDKRKSDNNYHLGDILISFRVAGEDDWSSASSAANRSLAIRSLPTSRSEILVSDLSNILPSPVLNITRSWSEYHGDIVLSFDVTNISPTAVEIGALGFPIEFNSIFTGQDAADVLQTGSFIDPYIGLDAGYAQVTRLNGTGPNLILTPFTNATKLEAWEFLSESSGSLKYQSNSFEGFYSWQVYSQALADTQWDGAEPWNTPTSYVLKSNETQTYAIRISLAPNVSKIEDTLYNNGRPVAVGIPGYILPTDTIGSLYIKSRSAPASFEIFPKGSLQITKKNPSPKAPWRGYTVQAGTGAFGRVRVTVTYADSTKQTVHYWVTHNSLQAPKLIGNHISQNQWYTNTSDIFGRAPSIMSWDRTDGSIVLQDSRVAVAGLSDEGGAGSFVALAMKQVLQPKQEEVKLLEIFVNKTAWGSLQDSSYGVKMSLFYYSPDDLPDFPYDSSISWKSAWNKTRSLSTDRAYNYVWVSALYWGLYKASRISPGILSYNTPEWYLQQASRTVARGVNASTGYSDAGLMGESFWGNLLQDLRAEGMGADADALESRFHERQVSWSESSDPFGSEQAWDCTGQEGVYFWSQYFNDSTTALMTIESIHGYNPTIPHWVYNGNARRYWDFLTAGQINLRRIERQGHHYGSGLNSLALLDWFRRSDNPASQESFYDLRVGYGGYMGPLSNIDADGFTSMSFHTFPQTMAWDNYTGDYGPNFLGHVQASGVYLVQHPDFGWSAFGGNLYHNASGLLTIYPRDTLRRRLFASHIGLYIELESGQIEEVTWSETTNELQINVTSDVSGATEVLFFTSLTSSVLGETHQVRLNSEGLKAARGGYIVDIPHSSSATLTWKKT
ncbi:hypothetical protein BDV39DRAFT_205456 [Aspergillus sergii]|uniref:Six-hairpin glycosidase-like protein n=1 Tax=Aspergillus sergii TaxID=1034303 RepID=A0A5N6X1G2_9EURO|nr:hypothetical protein BDV39DRAFT_205456 [Aspergillus sergii]